MVYNLDSPLIQRRLRADARLWSAQQNIVASAHDIQVAVQFAADWLKHFPPYAPATRDLGFFIAALAGTLHDYCGKGK